MKWIDGSTEVNNAYRRSKIQRCLSFSKPNLDVMYLRFNDLFGDIVDFSDSVSSIRWYPIRFPTDVGGSLETPKVDGQGPYEISVFDIPDSSSYLYLGEYNVKPFYNDFRDYNDSTKIKVFLPFCGFVDIDPIDCMNRWLQFRLNVDYATGNATYIIGETYDSIFNIAKGIGVDLDTSSKGLNPSIDLITRVISTINCNISIDIPIGSTNANDIVRNTLLNSVKIAGSAALTYLTKDPTPVISTTMTTKTYDVMSRGKYKGARLLPSKVGTETTESTRVQERAIDKSYIGINAFEESMNLLNSNISSSQTDRPNNCIDMVNLSHNIHVVRYLTRYIGNSYDDESMTESMDGNYYGYKYRHTFGLPLADFRTLGEVSGYTKIGEIHFEASLDDSANIDQATQYEVDLITSKLKEGIVL